MINRDNWKAVRKYLAYRREVDSLSAGSMRFEDDLLRHVLEWGQDTPFRKAPTIRPTLQDYLLRARLDGKSKQLSPVYIKKAVAASRRFFRWLSIHHRGYKSITPAWLDTLKPPKMTIVPNEHEAVTIEEMRAMIAAPMRTLTEKRIRAAAAFWFLSGIRIGAFLSLPLKAIDINARTVKQWPGLGVRTKFKKHATTYLLNIPELLAVVNDWDGEVRAVLPDNGLWFAPLSADGDAIAPYLSSGAQRDPGARRDLKEWLGRVGLPYHSPHKFRHGHAVYALKQSVDVADFKAVSQNLMHSNLSITDGVYGILSKDDVQARISALGNSKSTADTGVVQMLEKILAQLKVQ